MNSVFPFGSIIGRKSHPDACLPTVSESLRISDGGSEMTRAGRRRDLVLRLVVNYAEVLHQALKL